MTPPHARFTVRKQSSGYTLSETFIVVRRKDRARVTTTPHTTREAAQTEADELSISAMVRDYADDPRPYEERLEEARARYRTTRS